jgi:hypothetical protein
MKAFSRAVGEGSLQRPMMAMFGIVGHHCDEVEQVGQG